MFDWVDNPAEALEEIYIFLGLGVQVLLHVHERKVANSKRFYNEIFCTRLI